MNGVLFHGGVAGLTPGEILRPDMAHHRYVDGCAICEAHARGEQTALDPRTPEGWVYATSDRPYARYYASRAVNGWLYRVRLLPPIEISAEDSFPTWRAPAAEVVAVLERAVRLTMKDRRRLGERWAAGDRAKRMAHRTPGAAS